VAQTYFDTAIEPSNVWRFSQNGQVKVAKILTAGIKPTSRQNSPGMHPRT
jgi:hypothetical protein